VIQHGAIVLASAALGIAMGEADHRVREEGGENKGARIRQYLDNLDPPIASAAPYCAAFIQYCADLAARGLGMPNPLDEVRLEAYVQNYADTLSHLVVGPSIAGPGDLVLFYNFSGNPPERARWDHMGFVMQPVRDGTFFTVEANTGPAGGRDGNGVYVKPRTLDDGDAEPRFIRWSGLDD
jgi:hypothetical protein